jgi:hypothetical protein
MNVTATDNHFKVGANTNGLMDITLVKDGHDLGSVQIDTKKASALAAVILATVSEAFRLSGRPHPSHRKEDVAEYTVITPSGYNVGPGRKSGSRALMFYFGDTILGIELPDSELRTFGQRVMTAAADEGTPQ